MSIKVPVPHIKPWPDYSCTTPSEMRAEINKLRFNEPLVGAVLRDADDAGMSSEDRYTVLAFHALRCMRELQAAYIKLASDGLPPIYISTPNFDPERK